VFTAVPVLFALLLSLQPDTDAVFVTEAAALLTFVLGAFLPTGNYAVVLVVGGLTAVLLSLGLGWAAAMLFRRRF